MNETLLAQGEAETPPDAVIPVTAGRLLRQAREAAGLHIGALAVALKVPVRKIEALEADQLDTLPDTVFVRALAASICRTLKVDPAPVLALLPNGPTPTLSRSADASRTPFRAPEDASMPGMSLQLRRPLVLLVLGLLLATAALYFLPALQSSEPVTASAPLTSSAPVLLPTQPLTTAQPVVSEIAATPNSTPALVPASASVQPASASSPQPLVAAVASAASVVPLKPASASMPPKAATASVPLTVAAAASAAAATARTSASSASGAGAGAPVESGSATGIITFRTSAESWIEVTDARGVVVLRKIVLPGESSGASGSLPLSVVVGRSNATQVTVRGKSFDLAPVAKDNVARFEVK